MIAFLLLKKLYEKVVFCLKAVRLTFASVTNLRIVWGSFTDRVNPYGRVHFFTRNVATGEITCDMWEPNLVVNTGNNYIADQCSDRNEAPMSHMAVGTGTTGVQAIDTALENELDRNPLDSVTLGTGADANKIHYVCTWPAGDGTGALTEAGIFNSAAAGRMLCRSVFPVKNKDAGESTTMTWIISIA